MEEGEIAHLLREVFIVALKLSAPALLTALVVGLVVSLIQAMTQINETTLAFVPKLLALGLALTVAGSFMYSTLLDFTHTVFDQVVLAGSR